jgi:sugar lactone lactonase YvrE
MVCLASCAAAPDDAGTPPEPEIPSVGSVSAGWTASEGMDTPESAYFDEASGSIFVSQIVGAPDDRDGVGFISRLDSDGNVVDTMWFAGLNAPKGLRSHEGVLWVADIDRVVGISIQTGEIVEDVTIDGAQFLNDVAVSQDGTVYVSDMLATTIYEVADGGASVFAEGEELEYPNGLLVDGDRLVVAAWGRPNDDFTTDVPGRLFALNLETAEKTLITPEPLGNLDGVESDGRGGFIVSDYQAGTVMQVTASGEVIELRQFGPGTADLAFVPAGNVLLVPHMNESQVTAYDVSDAIR